MPNGFYTVNKLFVCNMRSSVPGQFLEHGINIVEVLVLLFLQ